MPYLMLVTVLALLQFLYFGIQVGRARGRYGVAAPATTGNEHFERHFRVQMNSLEQLVLFLPSLWMFGTYVSPYWGWPIGLVFVIGRGIYAFSYVRDPKSRSLGFALSMVPTLILLIGTGVAVVRTVAGGLF